MKNKLSLCAVLSVLLPNMVHAQSSVSLYGAIDTGIQYLTNSNAAGDSATRMVSSQYTPSRWGIKGTETLGSGLDAIFDLENMFNSNNGTMLQPGVLFNRNAYVGLDSVPFGTVTFGHQYTVQFDKTLYYSPSYLAGSSLLSLNIIPVSTLRVDNSVKYRSREFAGFNAEAMYGFGQQVAGDSRAGRYMGGSIEYTAGGFRTRGVYEEVRGTLNGAVDLSGQVDRRTSFAAMYTFASAMVSGGVVRVTGDLALSPPGTIYWLGARYSIRPDVVVLAEGGRYDYSGAQGRPTFATVTGQYLLSKRTMLYLNVAHMSNGGGSNLSVDCYAPSGAAGMGQWGTAVGLVQRF
ncbi:porin [Paraburkholderia sediminicola]|uniref:porin n=1 Tax=Paraburkholderia sediminicola TaxID=458836 RepID=UPI0038B9B3F5